MKNITVEQLPALLNSVNQGSFVSLVTETEPKLNKKNRETKAPNPWKQVVRVATRRGLIASNYENVVNNRREQENHPEEFRAEQLWNGAGEHVPGSKTLVRHKTTGKLYMVFYPTAEVTKDTWLADGEEVSIEALKPFLPPVSEGSKRQELENPVPWRVIALENIKKITVRGETYLLN